MTFCFWKKLGCYTSCCQPYFFSSRVFEPPAFRLFLKGLICQTGQLFHYSILGLETDDRAMSLAAVHVLSFCSILELLSVRARRRRVLSLSLTHTRSLSLSQTLTLTHTHTHTIGCVAFCRRPHERDSIR